MTDPRIPPAYDDELEDPLTAARGVIVGLGFLAAGGALVLVAAGLAWWLL